MIMRNKFLTLSIALIGAAFLFSSYQKAIPAAATGSLSVTCAINGAFASGVLVGVATSQENLDNSEYVFEQKETNSAGKVTYSAVAAGTYFIDAYLNRNDEDFWAYGEVTVGDGVSDLYLKLAVEEYEEEEED
jgi:hypothetical protein